MTRTVVIILLLFSRICASGQDYLITIDNQEIRGQIYFDLKGKYGKDKVVIKSEEGIRRIDASGIYNVNIGDKQFVVIPSGKQKVFAEVVQSGVISSYLIVDPYNTKRLQFEVKVLYKAGHPSLELTAQGFRKKLSEMMSDCNSTLARVESKEFSKADIASVIAEYNACTQVDKINLPYDLVVGLSEEQMQAVQLLLEFFESKNLSNEKDMLMDVLKKRQTGEIIPAYLIDGLSKSLADHNLLTTKLGILYNSTFDSLR